MKVITIGRSSENNIVINDAKVSRTHLQLVQNDNGVCSVVDLSSANGTFVNGQKITGEVRLQPHDVICIGNTTLSWQEYIKPSVATEQKPMDIVHPTPKPNKIWWYVAACVVFILFAAGIGLYYNGKEQEKIEEAKRNQEELQKEQLRQEAAQKAEEAKRLQDEVDELFRQALISQSDKNKKLAKTKQKEANEAKRQANIANKEKDKISAKAKQEVDDANQKAVRAQAAQQKAETIAEAAKKAEAKAKQAREVVELESKKAMELTAKFYAEEYEKMNKASAKQICEQLKKEIPKDRDAKMYLKDLFNNADNKGKQAIVDAIQIVKQQNSKAEKNNASEIKSDSLKFTKNAGQTDDKMSVKSDE